MNRYTSIWLSGEQTAEADWTLEESSVGEGEITLQLTPEQLADFSSAYYVILEKMDENYYTPVLDFVKLEPDENGVLHVPEEQKLFYLWVDGEETNEVWPWKNWIEKKIR